MKGTTGPASGWMVSAIVAVLASWLLALPLQVDAQNTCSGSQGQNGVYNATCNNGNPGIVGSSAFIDASMFAGNPPQRNICAVLNWVLNPSNGILPTTGAVIDARGVPGITPPVSMTCTASPWAGITNPRPSTILLPATGGASPNPIIIPNSSPWILPSNTHLIGEGDGIPVYSSGTLVSTPGTTIQAKSGFSGTMIQFGGASPICPSNVCTGISVENLTLDGQGGSAVNGIANANSQDVSYVNHVALYQILGTGLAVAGYATNSGPYSNITFDTGGSSGLPLTVCASINGLSGTRGIHGLSCNSETNDANAAVLLDSSNNSIEDVRIVGFYDGIRVGANAPAQSNVLFNIIGDTNATGGGTTPVFRHG
jgi:hypothetical protein